MQWARKKYGVAVLVCCAWTIGCQAENPVVGESLGPAVGSQESADQEFAGAAYQVLERIEGNACIPYSLSFEPFSGLVPCVLSQIEFAGSGSCVCDGPGLSNLHSQVVAELRNELRNSGQCDAGEGTPACEDLCACERPMSDGVELDACLGEAEFSGDRWCILDPDQGFGDPDLVRDCPMSKPHLLRFGKLEVPEGAALYLSCVARTPSVPVRELGESCIPAVETDPTFSGFTAGSVMAETRPRGCNSEVCLVQHFQGRVSCPYGQTEEQASSSPACFVPGTGVPIRTAVAPQLVSRPAELAAVCSCRCDGPDVSGDYCECPESMECAPLIEDLGLGGGLFSGSFCVPKGSLIADTGQDGPLCDPGLENCGAP